MINPNKSFDFPTLVRRGGGEWRQRVGGGGARGGDLTKESISSVGGLIEYLCSGVGTFDLFGRETGAKTKRGYLASSFLSLKWRGFRRR